MKGQTCIICGEKSVPGLVRGSGLCQEHFNERVHRRPRLDFHAERFIEAAKEAGIINFYGAVFTLTSETPVVTKDVTLHLQWTGKVTPYERIIQLQQALRATRDAIAEGQPVDLDELDKIIGAPHEQ